MKAERLGDRAILIRESGSPAPSLEAAKAHWPHLTDVVEAFGTLAFYFESEPPDPDELMHEIGNLGSTETKTPKEHEIPICYELGPDFESVIGQLKLDAEKFKALFEKAEFRVAAIGFSPGFPYLSGLPAELQGLRRLATPRQRVEPGSVGITFDMACIYPDVTPGGWNLIGRTPIEIVDLENDFFRFEVGDVVRFTPTDQSAFENWERS